MKNKNINHKIQRLSETNLSEKNKAKLEHLKTQVNLSGKFWRGLNETEKSSFLTDLSEFYDEQDAELKDELQAVFNPEIERVVNQAERAISTGDMVVAGTILYFYLNKTLFDLIKEKYQKAYQKGKKIVLDRHNNFIGEIKENSLPVTQYINQQTNAVVTTAIDELTNEARDIAQFGIMKKIGVVATIAALKKILGKKTNRIIQNISGTVIGDGLSLGRQEIYQKNLEKITGYKRTEVLDKRTCTVCRSLDEKVIEPDNPFHLVDLIHTNCRGEWLALTGPVLDFDRIPLALQSRFDTIGGVPRTNAFTQIKKPNDEQ